VENKKLENMSNFLMGTEGFRRANRRLVDAVEKNWEGVKGKDDACAQGGKRIKRRE